MHIHYISTVRIPTEKAAGLAIIRQCTAFAKIGHDVTLLIPNRPNVIKEDLFSYYGIENAINVRFYFDKDLIFLGYVGFGIMIVIQTLMTFLHVCRTHSAVDYYYTRDRWVALPLVFFGFSKKIIIEIHTKYDSKITNYILKRVRKVVVISNGLKVYYEKQTGRSDIQIEPSGVDLEQFEGVFSVEAIRTLLSIPHDKIVFAYIGKYQTMGEAKGVDEIVQAFAVVYAKQSNCHLLIAGLENEEFDAVKAVAQKAHLDNKGYTLSTLEQKRFAQYLVSSDILLMNYPNTEHYAHFMSPTKLFAYMAVGKPVVTSDLPTTREIKDVTGFRYVEQNGDVNSYAKAMEQVLLNLPSYNEEALKNKESVKRYSWVNRSRRVLENFN